MSEETNTAPETPKIVFVTIKMPDGKEYIVPMPSKIFSSGRHGFYSQIPPIAFNNEVYGGQIQIWKKTEK